MDAKYSLPTFLDDSVQSSLVYISWEQKIKNNKHGRVMIKINDDDRVYVYSAGLAVIFVLNEIPARDMNNRDVVIDTRPYLDEYATAFHKGEQDFDADLPSQNIIRGSKGREFMVELHVKYYHNGRKDWEGEGWNFVKRGYPAILTFDIIREFGYYSGIVHRVDAMIEKYPVLFRDFHTHGVFCNHSTTTAFEDVFPSPGEAARIKQLLILYGYADDNGGWIGRSTKVALVVDVLIALGILRHEFGRETAIYAFFDEFGLKVGPGGTPEKTLQKKRSPNTKEYNELLSLLS